MTENFTHCLENDQPDYSVLIEIQFVETLHCDGGSCSEEELVKFWGLE